MKKINFLALFILTILIASCNNAGEDLVGSKNNEETMAIMLNNAYDSLGAANPTLKDFRTNSSLNLRIVLTDYPGPNGTGRTIIKFDGNEIFNRTWNVPTYGNGPMMTVVAHGFSQNGEDYFLYIYNASRTSDSLSVYSEYRLFTIKSSGAITDITSKFKYYIFGLQEYKTGQYLIKSTDGFIRAPKPLYMSVYHSANGNVENYKLPSSYHW